MRWESRIWQLAKARGWQERQLARELGVSRTTLWRVRKGHTAPSSDLMFRSAQVFTRPVNELWWQEQRPAPEAALA